MKADTYTPGYGRSVLSLMGGRTAETHAGFFLAQLKPGWRVLDAGCGPGSITVGLARSVAPGRVIGIDIEESQFVEARQQAEREGLNVEFRKASVYELPFEDRSFDAAFSHALLEHLSDPGAAVRELRRILKPGGLIGLRAGDLGGLLMDAASEGPAQVLAAYIESQKKDSKEPNAGRKLGRFLRKAGFTVDKLTASYEVITETLVKIGPCLAEQFTPSDHSDVHAKAEDGSLFVALAWCEATGRAK